MYCNIYIYIHIIVKPNAEKIVATLSFNHNCQTFWSFRITIGMFLTGSHRTGPVIEVQILSNNTDRLEEPAEGCRAGGVLGYTHTYTHISLSVWFLKNNNYIPKSRQNICFLFGRARVSQTSQ